MRWAILWWWASQSLQSIDARIKHVREYWQDARQATEMRRIARESLDILLDHRLVVMEFREEAKRRLMPWRRQG